MTNEPDDKMPKRHYKWPWIFWGMIVLGIILAIIWMSFAVQKVERERGVNTPVQTQ